MQTIRTNLGNLSFTCGKDKYCVYATNEFANNVVLTDEKLSDALNEFICTKNPSYEPMIEVAEGHLNIEEVFNTLEDKYGLEIY